MQTAGIAIILPFGWLPLRSRSARAPFLLRSGKICTFAVTDRCALSASMIGHESASKCLIVVLIKKFFIMAKGSQFWGNASGKLGEQVLYRAGGEQRARTYVKNIKNPRSLGQAVNRLSMRNFATAFRANGNVLRLSFPNRPAKESGFNAFVKANKSAKSAAIDKYAASFGYYCPYGLVMSEGTLPRLLLTLSPAMPEVDASVSLPEISQEGWTDEEVIAFGAKLGMTIEDASSLDGATNNKPTEAHLSAFLEKLGYPAGSVLTFIRANYMDEGFQNSTTDYSMNIQWNGADFHVTIHLNDTKGISDDQVYYCAMVSAKVNGKLNVSPSRFEPIASKIEYASQFLEGGELYDQIVSDYINNSEYLPSVTANNNPN